MAKLYGALLLIIGISFSLYMVGYESGYTVLTGMFNSDNALTTLLDSWKTELISLAAIGIIASLALGGNTATGNVLNFFIFSVVIIVPLLITPLGFLFDPTLPEVLRGFMLLFFMSLYAVIAFEYLTGREA